MMKPPTQLHGEPACAGRYRRSLLGSALSASLLLVLALLSTAPTLSAAPRELDSVAAVVNTEVITRTELARRVEQTRQQLRERRIEVPPDDVLRRQVLERMITDRAQLQLARESGLRIDDAQIDRAVANIADSNRMSPAQLRERVQADGLSWSQFRDDVRAELVQVRLREREVESRVQVSEADVDAFMAERSGQASAPREYRLAQILLRVPEGASADDIQRRRAQANELLNQARAPGADFAALAASRSDAPDAMSGGDLGWRVAERIPQIFLEALAGLKTGELAVVRSPNGFHLLKLLDQRNATSAEAAGAKSIQYRARHILIRRDEPGGESAALQKLAEIRQRIASGAVEFAQMARQFSADGTASRGGDLGWVLQGDTVPEFERALQSLQPGQLSEPVATQFGFHLIQLQERRESTGSSERQRSAARQALREQRVDEAYQDWLRQLRDRTYVEIRLDER